MKVKHLVLLKFKSDVTDEQKKECMNKLMALQTVIPGIESAKWGTYSSNEGLNQGFTHGFEMTFSSAKDRDNYLIDPQHQAVASTIVEKLENSPGKFDGVVAFDYEHESPAATPRTVCDGIEAILASEEITSELLKNVSEKLEALSQEVSHNPAKYERKLPLGFLNQQKPVVINNQNILSRIDKLKEEAAQKMSGSLSYNK